MKYKTAPINEITINVRGRTVTVELRPTVTVDDLLNSIAKSYASSISSGEEFVSETTPLSVRSQVTRTPHGNI